MTDLLKLFTVFVLILILLRRRWNVGYVLLLSSAALGLLYLMSPERMYRAISNTVTSPVTISLLIILTFIRVFEFVLREKGVLKRMMETMKSLLRSHVAVIISMPLLIGLMPSVGGAYFSAPMVAEASRETMLSPEEKAFANYWYRHPWEFILPLYPGIILASAITGIELRTFILLNLGYAVVMVLAGLWFLRGAFIPYRGEDRNSWRALLNLMPILVLLALVLVFHVPLHYGLVILTLFLMPYYRMDRGAVKKAFRHGFSLDIIVLILGVMLFKEVLEVSGSVENMSNFFQKKSIPLLPVVFLLPFITGILTGITVGFVASTFPLLLSLAGPDPYLFTFAFASGYVGVLLSPVHVCFVLTREYFGADVMRVYRMITPLCLLILLVSVAEMFLLGG